MSMRLHERLFDYDATFTDNKYYYCYVTDTLTKEQILYIEKHPKKNSDKEETREIVEI